MRQTTKANLLPVLEQSLKENNRSTQRWRAILFCARLARDTVPVIDAPLPTPLVDIAKPSVLASLFLLGTVVCTRHRRLRPTSRLHYNECHRRVATALQTPLYTFNKPS